MTKAELQAELREIKRRHDEIIAAISAIDHAPENNVFASLEEASAELEERLRDEAAQDCEGSHNCGADVYVQEFIVDGVHYVGYLHVEYGRHDKTYYFIDSARFEYAKKGN
jgi:hypothetical protein